MAKSAVQRSQQTEQTPPASTARKRSFDAVFGSDFHSSHHPVKRCIAIYMIPAAFTAIGAISRGLLGSTLTLLVLAAIGIVWMLKNLRGRDGTGPHWIDWATAEDYEAQLRTRLNADALAVIDETANWTRLKRGGQVHTYLISCACGATDADCTCAVRWSAGIAVLPRSRHRVIAVGDRLAHGHPGVLRFVLAHERQHITGWPRRSFEARTIATTMGFLAVGELASTSWFALIATALGLRLVCTFWGWLDEYACDITATRRYGEYADAWCRAMTTQTKRYYATFPRRQRPFVLAARALPTHPPLRVRAWYCRNAHTKHRHNTNPYGRTR